MTTPNAASSPQDAPERLDHPAHFPHFCAVYTLSQDAREAIAEAGGAVTELRPACALTLPRDAKVITVAKDRSPRLVSLGNGVFLVCDFRQGKVELLDAELSQGLR